MKITITPADIRNVQEALSRIAAAQQWADIVSAGGIDITPIQDRINANKRICEGMLTKIENIQGAIV